MYCRSDRPILCGNLIGLTERNVYILGLFVFINTSMLVRKTWDALHTKNVFAAFPFFIANAVSSGVQNRMIFRDKEASFVNSVTETSGAF